MLRQPLMLRRILRNLHSTMLGMLVLAVLGGFGFLFWLNHVGLTDEVRDQLAGEIARKGIFLEFESLRYEPLQGLVARDVTVFTDRTKALVAARLGSLVIDVDKTKLLRRQVKVTKIVVSEGELSVAVEPQEPDSEILQLSNFSGSIFLGKGRSVDIRNARGSINGINLELDARLKTASNEQGSESGTSGRVLFRDILRQLAEFQFDRQRPPRVTLAIDGDLDQQASLRCRATLESARLAKGGYALANLKANATYEHGILTINELHGYDQRGAINARVDYSITTRSGRFSAESSLDVAAAIRALAPDVSTDPLTFNQPPILSTTGTFQLPDQDKPLQLRASGHARCGSLTLDQSTFTDVSCDFSWQDGQAFLRDLHLTHPRGKLAGKVMLTADDIRFQFHSNLPASVYQPFFAHKLLGRVLNMFAMDEKTIVSLDLEGSVSRADTHQWACWGQAEVSHLAFAGVPARHAKGRFSLNTLELRFEDVAAEFDYSNYPLRKAFRGPDRGNLSADRIVYDMTSELLTLDNVRGTAWPAPVLRTCYVPIADHLEQYRFHTPPKIQASGTIGFGQAAPSTDLTVRFESEADATYKFLNADLVFGRPRATVRVRQQSTEIKDLSFGFCGGSVNANLGFPRVEPATFTSEVTWKSVSLNEVISTWGLLKKDRPPLPGIVTGRCELAGTIGTPTTYSGRGLLALADGELFSVPMFGPLSPLISAILGDKKAGFQAARDAFLTFNVEKGVMRTNDFKTSTTSLVFTGDGSVNLADAQLDFIMRMNARGLLGIITLPLRPFYGLFQFRGTGPISEPKWDNVRFTHPPDGDANPIFKDPPRAKVVTE